MFPRTLRKPAPTKPVPVSEQTGPQLPDLTPAELLELESLAPLEETVADLVVDILARASDEDVHRCPWEFGRLFWNLPAAHRLAMRTRWGSTRYAATAQWAKSYVPTYILTHCHENVPAHAS